MKILLNGEKLDITLEKEKTLFDIHSGMQKWLRESEMVITSLNWTNGRGSEEMLTNTDEKNLENILIKDTETLSITALPVREVRLSGMESAVEYLTLVTKVINKPDNTLISELELGYLYIKETITHIFTYTRDNKIKAEVENLFTFFSGQDLKTLTEQLTGELKTNLLNTIKTVLSSIRSIMNEEFNPLAALKENNSHIKALIEEVNEVSVLLQTGKDKEAMESIIRLTEQLQIFFRLMGQQKKAGESLKPEGRPFEEFYRELNDILKELIGAFDIKDYVLIGDLLEYEIAPRLEEISKLSGNLIKVLEKNDY